MAWTTPRTWVTGELVTAAILNTYVRDNQLALYGGSMSITSQAAGDVVYASSSTALARLAKDAGKFLKSGASAVSWDTVAFSGLSPLTTRGDVLIATSGTVTGTRLAVGASGRVLTSDGTDVSWGVASNPNINEGRLTLTSGTAVTTADVTGAGTVYFALDRGDKVSLYDGSANWETVTFAEMSIALSGGTASKPNDIFLDYNGGSPALAILAWTNDTTRATAIVKQNGVWCKTGDLQQRYLGTVYLDGSQQCEDSFATRHCFNISNQRVRPLHRVDGTTSWTYTSSSYRQADGDAGNQLDVMLGVDQSVNIHINATSSSNSDARWRTTAIGLDGLTVTGLGSQVTETGGEAGNAQAFYSRFPGVGRRYFVWMERSSAAGTTTFYGNDTYRPSGMGGFTMG